MTTDPDSSEGHGAQPAGAAADLALNSWIGPVRLGRRAALLRRRRGLVTAVVLVVSILTCVGLSAVAGSHATSERLRHLTWPFLAIAVLAHCVAYSGYLVAHHQVLSRPAAKRVSWKAGAQVVVIGFGAWLIAGGFEVDRRALVHVGLAEADAGSAAIALGALELAVLAPAAWVCALMSLGTDVTGTVTIPWVIGVPAGLVVTVAVALSQRARRLTRPSRRSRLARIPVDGLASMLGLVKDPRRAPAALAGIAIYWAGDIVALWAALRFVSTTVELPRLIVGYATGYVLTRRTLPFAGALITEALLALSLVWVGIPLASAAIAVLVYRLSDFTLTFGAALLAGSAVERTLTFVSAGAETVETEPGNRRDPVTPPHLPGGNSGRNHLRMESPVSAEQRENLEAILRRGALPVDSDVAEQRRLFKQLSSAQPLPADVTVTAAALGGVPTAEVTVEGIESRHVVLYFHSGVYVIGDAFSTADLASQVGRRTQAKVISVDYRLAPEHPYPAAVDDAFAAYEALLDDGVAASDIILAGESAGGGLAIATMINARDRRLPTPAAAFLMSPYVDLTLAGTTMDSRREVDPLLSRELLRPRVADYTSGQDAGLALISPIFADLVGLPPLLIQSGTHEVLLDDSLRLARVAATADVEVTLDVTPGVPHVFQSFYPILDEAVAALDRAGQLLSAHLAAAGRDARP